MKTGARYRFRLYVAGRAPNSLAALANLRAFCAERLADRHEIEVVDALEHPERAVADGVVLTPALVTLSPQVRTLVGALRTASLLQVLGLSRLSA